MSAGSTVADIMPADAVANGDEASRKFPHLGAPEAVVRPSSVDEVAAVMRWAAREGVGVLPMGSGRHARPVPIVGPGRKRWVALTTERLAGVEIYEAADLTLTAGAGTLMCDLDATLRANRQWAPVDPPAVPERSLGGLVADGAYGPLASGYGELRNHVLGMTVVTGDGRVLRLGGRVVKNVAGFDLIRPMTGSRGSLAVMTSVCLRVFPVPQEDLVLLRTAATVSDLADAAVAVGTAPILPVSSLLVDRLDAAGGDAALVVRLHGASATVDADRRTLEAHLGSGLEAVEPDGRAGLLEQARDRAGRGAATVLASASPSRLHDLLSAIEEAQPAALAVDPYLAVARIAFDSVDPGALATLTQRVEHIGGAVRVEHARDASVGRAGSMPTAPEARLLDRLRSVFDPEGVLWPTRL